MKRIWPLDDKARISADGVFLGEEEQRGGPLSWSGRARTPHSISCARPRLLLLHRLSSRLLRCGQPRTKHERESSAMYIHGFKSVELKSFTCVYQQEQEKMPQQVDKTMTDL